MEIKTVRPIEKKSFSEMVDQVNYLLENYPTAQWDGAWQVHNGVFYTTVSY